MPFWKKNCAPSSSGRPFDLDTPLLYLSPSPADAFTLRDACSGVQCFGATGSGKSSSVNRAFTRAYLQQGFGALITTTKPGDTDEYLAFCDEAGRLDDVIRFGPDSGYAFNPFRYEQTRPGAGSGLTENIVGLIRTILEAGDLGSGGGASGGARSNETFWRKATDQIMRNSVDLLQFAGQELSLTSIQEVLATAPLALEQVQDPTWQAGSYCWRCLQLANQRPLSEDEAYDCRATVRFWCQDFPTQDPKTRSNILISYAVMADAFSRGLIRQLFSTDLNVVPEMCASGAIWIIDLPTKVYGDVARQATCLIKYCWQQAMERRDVRTNPRPVALIIDESDQFLTESDLAFQATARSARVCTLLLTQSIAGYQCRLGGGGGMHNTHAFLANLTTKIFTANSDPSTYEYAEQLFGKHWASRSSSSVSTPGSQGKGPNSSGGGGGASGGGGQVSSSTQQQVEAFLQGSELNRLRVGGPANDRQVQALCFQMGRTWAHSGTPVLPVVFNQASS
ncbi:MAG: type IV secretory system conjugative DNA transfer family protein [Planctomycetota bacterium]